MASRRCGICAVDWPDDKSFNPCPACSEPTRVNPYADEDPDDLLTTDQIKVKVETWARAGGHGKKSPLASRGEREKEEWVDAQVAEFSEWLKTATADDFKV